jgi:superfamily II DNA/RNA helicase
MFRGPTSRRNI